ncbi:hypothetical protein EON79_20130 [bacterium]|nr:MAG: hypothetical protein EON79_20130 [bacterium]
MTDDRDDAEKSREAMGVKPTEHATFEEPTGADVVAAEPKETITDGGLLPPEEDEVEPPSPS